MECQLLPGNSRHLFHSDGGKRGIKTYLKKLVVVMLNEYKQCHNLDVLGLQDATIMSRQEKSGALRAVNFNK